LVNYGKNKSVFVKLKNLFDLPNFIAFCCNMHILKDTTKHELKLTLLVLASAWSDLRKVLSHLIVPSVAIKMDLRGIRWDGVDWVDIAQDRDQWRALVNMVLNLRVS
jgi:hypothetical protein